MFLLGVFLRACARGHVPEGGGRLWRFYESLETLTFAGLMASHGAWELSVMCVFNYEGGWQPQGLAVACKQGAGSNLALLPEGS